MLKIHVETVVHVNHYQEDDTIAVAHKIIMEKLVREVSKSITVVISFHVIYFIELKDAIETKKHFSKRTKKTARNSSSDAVSDFLEKTPPCIIPLISRKSSATGKMHRKKSDTNSASQYNRIRSRIKPTKDACGIISPCKNGGTCKSLSNGSYYCFCSQDYYGKTCKNSK
jgi:hypothetical protein